MIKIAENTDSSRDICQIDLGQYWRKNKMILDGENKRVWGLEKSGVLGSGLFFLFMLIAIVFFSVRSERRLGNFVWQQDILKSLWTYRSLADRSGIVLGVVYGLRKEYTTLGKW